VFHPPFAELWAMDFEELEFWLDRVTWINEKRRG
jgi:hypothetical protein